MIGRWLRQNLQHLAAIWLFATIVVIVLWGGYTWLLAIPALALIALVADGIARPGSSVFYPTVCHGPRTRNAVALTFDDGPDPQTTPQLLDLLAQAHAHATFFVIARKLKACPQLVQRMRANGHCIASHSWQHARFQNFWGAQAHGAELDRAQQALAKIGLPAAATLYRPPVGLKSGALAKAAHARRLTCVAWSLHAHDTRLGDPAAIAHRVLKRVRPGDIILMHDGHDLPGHHRPHCLAAVRLILAGLQERHMECVTLPDLIGTPGRGRANIAKSPNRAHRIHHGHRPQGRFPGA